MVGFLFRRVAWMLPALFGITLVTFLLIEAAELELHGVHASASMQEDAEVRAQRAHELQEQWGMLDPETGERYPIWKRYGQWVGRVACLDFVGPGRNREVFYERIRSAVPVTVFLNVYALLPRAAARGAVRVVARLARRLVGGQAWDRRVAAGLQRSSRASRLDVDVIQRPPPRLAAHWWVWQSARRSHVDRAPWVTRLARLVAGVASRGSLGCALSDALA